MEKTTESKKWSSNCNINIDELIKAAKKEQVEIRVTIEPERMEIEIEPWKPYEPRCPYGKVDVN